MRLFTQRTERGTILTVAPDEGPSVVLSIPDEIASTESPFAAKAAELVKSVEAFVEAGNAANARLLPDARNTELGEIAARTLGPPVRALMAEGQREARDFAAADAHVMQPVPETASSLYREYRERFAGLSIAEKAQFVQSATVMHTSALLEAGPQHFPDVPREIWNDLEERHAVAAHIHRTGLQAAFQRAPTADRPIDTGPDVDAALRAAQAALAQHRGRRERLATLEASLRSVSSVVAVAAGLPDVNSAFRLLTEVQQP